MTFGLSVNAQTVECPKELICLTQAEANVVRNNALELEVTKSKVSILEGGLKDKDTSISEIKETAKKKSR